MLNLHFHFFIGLRKEVEGQLYCFPLIISYCKNHYHSQAESHSFDLAIKSNFIIFKNYVIGLVRSLISLYSMVFIHEFHFSIMISSKAKLANAVNLFLIFVSDDHSFYYFELLKLDYNLIVSVFVRILNQQVECDFNFNVVILLMLLLFKHLIYFKSEQANRLFKLAFFGSKLVQIMSKLRYLNS